MVEVVALPPPDNLIDTIRLIVIVENNNSIYRSNAQKRSFQNKQFLNFKKKIILMIFLFIINSDEIPNLEYFDLK